MTRTKFQPQPTLHVTNFIFDNQGSTEDFCLGEEVDSEKDFGATQREEKNFLGLLGGSGGMFLRKILKR